MAPSGAVTGPHNPIADRMENVTGRQRGCTAPVTRPARRFSASAAENTVVPRQIGRLMRRALLIRREWLMYFAERDGRSVTERVVRVDGEGCGVKYRDWIYLLRELPCRCKTKLRLDAVSMGHVAVILSTISNTLQQPTAHVSGFHDHTGAINHTGISSHTSSLL